MSSRKRTVLSIIWMMAVIAGGMAMLFAAVSHAAHPFPVTLLKYDGTSVAAGDNVPYSPALSCSDRNGNSACHSYSTITNAYHFQQGRTNASGAIVVSDTFNTVKPWILSAGMYGKW